MLDFCIYLEDDSPPIESIGLGVDAHWELVKACENAQHRLFLRASDYYADATFDVHEFPALLAEVKTLRALPNLSAKAKSFLDELTQLVELAKKHGRAIEAICD